MTDTEVAANSPPALPLPAKQLEAVKKLVELKGGTNREIAIAMGLTEGTVKVHIKNAMATLRTKSRTGLALWYIEWEREQLPISLCQSVGP